MSVLSQLLSKVNPAGFELQEAGILMQAVALDIVIYHLSDMTPGEWFHESTTDIKRALVAIGLLVTYADKNQDPAAVALQPAASSAAQPNPAPGC
jgi:hypothetical protein